MKLVFFSNYLNHHQVLVADELHHLLGDEYTFVATMPRNEKELKGGADYSSRPYCILAGESEEAHRKALKLAREAEVCVFGACSQEYAVARAQQENCGLAFELGERWLKKGWLNILSPTLRTWWKNYHRYYKNKPFFKLCCSAFAAQDDEKLHAYKGRHYKWGYFTAVPETRDGSQIKSQNKKHRILWCARFIDWKHPELAIKLAERLKRHGYSFEMTLIGNGDIHKKCVHLAEQSNVTDVITFAGSMPNQEVLKAMTQHDIFLFTSDKNEGWGAVSNEAMSNQCCLVASDKIGSTPYLIHDGENGLSFKTNSLDSLYEKVSFLLDNPERLREMAERGYQDMENLWNPKNAASCLLQLIDDLKKGRVCSIKQGPCSIA